MDSVLNASVLFGCDRGPDYLTLGGCNRNSSDLESHRNELDPSLALTTLGIHITLLNLNILIHG